MIYNIFNKYKYVSIEGNIGAGKTSLTKMICKKFKIKGLFENYITNPYLKKSLMNLYINIFNLTLAFYC